MTRVYRDPTLLIEFGSKESGSPLQSREFFGTEKDNSNLIGRYVTFSDPVHFKLSSDFVSLFFNFRNFDSSGVLQPLSQRTCSAFWRYWDIKDLRIWDVLLKFLYFRRGVKGPTHFVLLWLGQTSFPMSQQLPHHSICLWEKSRLLHRNNKEIQKLTSLKVGSPQNEKLKAQDVLLFLRHVIIFMPLIC